MEPDTTNTPNILIPRGYFSLCIEWKKGVTQEEMDATMSYIRDLTEELATQPEDTFPLMIDAITYRRDSKSN